MKLFVLVGSALGLYLLAAACAMFAPSGDGASTSSDPHMLNAAPAAPRTGMITSREGLPYRSISMQIQRPDWIEKYKQSIDEIANVDADTVKFVVDARQENAGSSHIYLDL